MFIIEWWRELENSEKMFVLLVLLLVMAILIPTIAYGIIGTLAAFLFILALFVTAAFAKLILMMFDPAEIL